MENSEVKSIKPDKAKIKYDKQFTKKMRFYRTVVAPAGVFAKILFRTKVVGRENMPTDGACFVCCNHLSNWDPVLLAAAVKRPLHYMAKKEIFGVPVLSGIVKALGAFPVDRDNADVTAIKIALTHLKHGNAIGIFPQGTRCVGEPPETLSVKSGVGMMVYKTRDDVIPVSIYTKGYKVLPFRRIYVKIGKPIKFDEYGIAEKGLESYQKISDEIFDRVCSGVRELKEAAENGR